MSYRELDDLANRVGAAVHRAGRPSSGRVAYWAEATVAGVAAVWGIPRAGAWAVPISPQLPPARSMELTRSAGVQGLWALPGDAEPAGLRLAVGELPGAGPPDPTVCYVVFTSGTAGTPKGVMLTGEAIEASAWASQQRLGNGPDDAWLCVLPTHHVGGLSILWRSAREGAPVLLEEGFDAGRCAGLLADGRARYASLVPTMLRRLLEAHPGPYRGVKAVLVGGGPVDAELMERARDAGLPALATYGMTETASQVATESPGEAGKRSGSVGRPLEGAELRIVDGEGRALGHGAAGIIEVRGPMVSPGYAGGERTTGEWHRTADLGRLDSDGYLTVLGRADRVIVTGGENVHPAEVEAAVVSHPTVADALVYGVPDPEWGGAVAADVELAEGAVWDERAVAGHVGSRLAGHQVPKRWRVVDRIVRNDLGKPRLGAD